MDEQTHTPPPESGSTTEEATSQPAPTSQSGSNAMVIGIVIVLLALASIAAYHFWPQLQSVTSDDTASEESDSGPVAMVNGQPITRAQYDETVERVTAQATQQGLDTSDPEVADEIKNQVIDSLVNNELLRQEAAEANINPTDDAIDTQMASIVTQFGGQEALQQQMDDLNMTEADVRADIAEQLAVDELISNRVDLDSITVTEEEIQTFYDSVAEQNPDAVPALADVHDQIETQLQSQKEQQLIQQLLETLRAEANVEVLI